MHDQLGQVLRCLSLHGLECQRQDFEVDSVCDWHPVKNCDTVIMCVGLGVDVICVRIMCVDLGVDVICVWIMCVDLGADVICVRIYHSSNQY